MKQKLLFILLMICTAPFVSGQSQTNGKQKSEEDVPLAYGYRIFDKVDQTYAIVSFPVNAPDKVTVLSQRSEDGTHFCAAEYFNGKIYAYTYTQDIFGGTSPEYFEIYNAETYELIIRKNPLPYMMHDMAYDYTTNTMYGLVEEKENSEKLIKANLCIIDIETGDYTVVGDIGTSKVNGALLTLACDKNGQLYSESEFRCFYKIDKNTGIATQVGDQGKLAVNNNLQSMAFEHNTNILYWAHTTPDYGWWTTIDQATGIPTKMGTLGGDAEITGLFFKNKANPAVTAKVNDLIVATTEPGGLQVKLSWNNPEKTLNGETLNTLQGVKIYRIGESDLIADVKTTVIGGKGEYTDPVKAPGTYTYRVIPYNEEGMGISQTISFFAGNDQAEAVSGLTAILDGQTATVEWTAPKKSVNGGYVDYANLRYNVYRVSGTETLKVGDAISNTKFTEPLTKTGAYSYIVAPIAGGVEGIAATSNKLLIEGVTSIPYFSGFEDADDTDFWKIVDVNNDSKGWAIASGYGAISGKFAQASSHKSNVSNDWLLSPEIRFEGGKTYLLKFDVNAGYYAAKFNVALGKGTQVENFTTFLLSHDKYESSSWATLKVRVTVPETGDYRLGWHYSTGAGYATLKLDNVSLEEIPAIEAQVNGIYIAPPSCSLNENSPVSVEIENVGLNDLTDIPVTLQTTEQEYSESISQVIKPGEKYTYKFTKGADLRKYGLHALRAWVAMPGDLIMANDTTEIAFTYHAKPSDMPFSIGFETEEAEALFGWKVSNDAATDGQGWILPVSNKGYKGKQSVGYKASSSKAADHWLYSTCLNVKANTEYKLTYYVLNNNSSEKTNTLLVKLGQGQDPEEMTEEVGELTIIGKNDNWQKVTQYFTPSYSGVYYIGWHITSKASMGDLVMDEMKIEEGLDKDVAIVAVEALFPLSSATQIKATLVNNSAIAAKDISVSYQVDGTTLATEKVASIEPHKTLDCIFERTCDMSKEVSYTIAVSVTMNGDQNPGNDNKEFKAVNSGKLTLDFESCKDFEVDGFTTSQAKQWTVIDGDKATTYGIGDYLYPNKQKPFALMSFNHQATDPAMAETSSFRPADNGGARIGLFMSVNFAAANDWLISPKVLVKDADAVFKMLARDVRSASSDIADYYIEVATTENVPEAKDFLKLTPEVCHPTTSWEEYTYSLEDYVGQKIWVAVHHVSSMKYAFLVDNLSFTGCADALEVGIENNSYSGISVYPNPFDTEFVIDSQTPIQDYKIYDLQGRLVISRSGINIEKITVQTDGLTSAMYHIRINTTEGIQTFKLIKK